jgi:DNA-binding NtrC family response regulator
MSFTVLIVDDEENARLNITSFLTSQGYEEFGVATLEEAREVINKGTADIILLDVQLPDGYGPSLLEETNRLPMRPPVIIITAFGEIDMAVDAMRNGAHDYLQKPIQLDRLAESIQRACEIVAMRRELAHLMKAQHQDTNVIIGNSKAMQLVFDQAHRAAVASVSVLITGETGTGKELVAAAIHKRSKRKDRSFFIIFLLEVWYFKNSQ